MTKAELIELATRLERYGPCLDREVCIADRTAVDEAAKYLRARASMMGDDA